MRYAFVRLNKGLPFHHMNSEKKHQEHLMKMNYNSLDQCLAWFRISWHCCQRHRNNNYSQSNFPSCVDSNWNRSGIES
jgi:hypothetical protein